MVRIVALLFYLVYTTGVPVYAHFCGEVKKSQSILVGADACCGEQPTDDCSDDAADDADTETGCCHNQAKLAKGELPHFAEQQGSGLQPCYFLLPAAPMAWVPSPPCAHAVGVVARQAGVAPGRGHPPSDKVGMVILFGCLKLAGC